MENLNFTQGMYNISNEEYHCASAVSRSDLVMMMKSPYHYNMSKKIQQIETSAMKFGTAFHTFCLEPDIFLDKYEIEKKFDKRTKLGKEEYNNFVSNNVGKFFISQEDLELIQNMYNSIKLNSDAFGLIKKAQYEQSMFWQDDKTKIMCKSRPDIIRDNIICDLKTTASAEPYKFKRSIFEYGLDIQAAMMLEGWAHCNPYAINDFAFIAVEKEYPFSCAVYFVGDDILEIGYNKFEKLIEKYKYCKDNDVWPMYETQKLTLN